MELLNGDPDAKWIVIGAKNDDEDAAIEAVLQDPTTEDLEVMKNEFSAEEHEPIRIRSDAPISMKIKNVITPDGEQSYYVDGELILTIAADGHIYPREDSIIQWETIKISIDDLGLPIDEWTWEDVTEALKKRGLI